MSPAQQVGEILRELNLKDGQFFLSGSAPLALRGLRPIGDLDVGVTTRYWFELLDTGLWRPWTTNPDDELRRCDPPYLVREVGGVEVNVFYAWRRRVRDGHECATTDYNYIFKSGLEDVAGWPCLKLEILLRLKADNVRPKDLPDIAALARIIEAEAEAAV